MPRFDRDQFNHFIRQFLHVEQSGPVLDYITLFDELMHQLLAHDPLVNLAFLTNKFIDGLHDDIKSVVLLHRPKDLDTASSLACWVNRQETSRNWIILQALTKAFTSLASLLQALVLTMQFLSLIQQGLAKVLILLLKLMRSCLP